MKRLKLNLDQLSEELEMLDPEHLRGIKGGYGESGGSGGYGGYNGGPNPSATLELINRVQNNFSQFYGHFPNAITIAGY
ncbi:hypothetical protein D3C78_1720530 [compost metagenome]